MKMLTLSLVLLANSAFASVTDKEVVVSAKGSQYTARARFDSPLSTYERCDGFSWAGQEAEARALESATDACQAGYNLDCIHVSTTYNSVMSHEFIGYKTCEAVVRLRGYRLSSGK
jgi:hypothetical protein